MHKLSLKGFLKSYLKELSYVGTSNMHRLLRELDENPRLREPLIIYGIISGTSVLIEEAEAELIKEYIEIKKKIIPDVPVEEYREFLPAKYRKVITAYEYKLNRISRDNDTKLLMRGRILQIQKEILWF